jgi:hypothetical protein
MGVLLLGASSTRAAENDDTVRLSRERYKKGEELFSAGRYADAYTEFEAGYALVPRPLFLLNMAHSDRRRGQLRSARALYRRYIVMEPDSKFRAEVESVLQEIETVIASEDAAAKASAPPPAPPPPMAIAPKPLPPPPPAPLPIHKRWWFWAAAGGAVASAITAAIFLSRGDSYEKSGSLGSLGMP